MRQEFTLDIPARLAVSSNRTAPPYARRKTKEWMRAHTPRLVPVGSADVLVGITKRTHGRYDPANLTDTFKGCVDALVSNGTLEDDDYKHVVGPLVFHEGVDRLLPRGVIRARVILAPYRSTILTGVGA